MRKERVLLRYQGALPRIEVWRWPSEKRRRRERKQAGKSLKTRAWGLT